MKVDAKFTSKDNKLYRISDNTEVAFSCMRIEAAMICGKELEPGAKSKMISEFTATRNKMLCLYLPWFLVEPEPESYNEALLASLRDFLKEIESSGLHVIIVPQPESDSSPIPLFENKKIISSSADLLIAAMKHTARRIKDCDTIIGFSVPKELFVDGFDEGGFVSEYISELSQKHSHYVFFAKKDELESCGCLAEIKKTNIVLY